MQVERDEAMRRVFRRRRRAALAALGVMTVLVWWGASSQLGGSGSGTEAKQLELPGGGRQVLPRYRVLAFYGAPQDPELGVLGVGSPEQAARRLLAHARDYARGRPVLPAFELIAVIAHSAPGQDGLHRERQSVAVIRSYLNAVRRLKGLLILDIQPGQADFVDEAEALEPYLAQPDVGLALDSEWSVPSGTVPGQLIGSIDAATVNRVSYYLARLVHRRRLPQKLLLVHQFTEGMVKDDARIRTRPGIAIVANVDGFGQPEQKVDVYRRLATEPPPVGVQPLRFNGFKLFFEEDTNLMSPASVLGLRPQPDVIVYE